MKLHLPKPLRNSVLACIAAVAGIATPTLGTATFAGGVVAFTLASQQAAAADQTLLENTTWNADNTTTAGSSDTIYVGGTDQNRDILLTIQDGANIEASWLVLRRGGDVTMTGGNLQLERLHVHNFNQGGTTEVFTLSGGTVLVTATDDFNNTQTGQKAAVTIGHWGNGGGTVIVSGGTFTVASGSIYMGHDSRAQLQITGGTVNTKGLYYSAQNVESELRITDGRLNIGTGGINNTRSASTKVSLLGGTVGALSTEGWTLSGVTTTIGAVTIDTNVWNAEANTSTNNGAAITLLGSAQAAEGGAIITLAGSGALKLSKDVANNVQLNKAAGASATLTLVDCALTDLGYATDGQFGDTGESGFLAGYHVVKHGSTVNSVNIGDASYSLTNGYVSIADSGGALSSDIATIFEVRDNVTYDAVGMAGATEIRILQGGVLTVNSPITVPVTNNAGQLVLDYGSGDIDLNGLLNKTGGAYGAVSNSSTGVIIVDAEGNRTLNGDTTLAQGGSIVIKGGTFGTAESMIGAEIYTENNTVLVLEDVEAYFNGANDQQLSINVMLKGDTSVHMGHNDVLNYSGDHTYTLGAGTLMDVGDYRQTVKGANALVLQGATICGAGGEYTPGNYVAGLDFYSNGTIHVTENSLIATGIASRNGDTEVTYNVSSGKTLDIGTYDEGENQVSGNLVGPGRHQLQGGGTMNILVDATPGILAVDRGKMNIGLVGQAVNITANQLEMGDNNGQGVSILNVNAGSTLVVTGADTTENVYKTTGFIMSEWNSESTINIYGKLLAENATAKNGDWSSHINLKDGGLLAVKGLGCASGQSAVNLNMEAGSTLILGETGIDVHTLNTNIKGGTIGISAEEVAIAENISIAAAKGLVLDTAMYTYNETGTDVTRGELGGKLTISGNVDGTGKLTKSGAGTLDITGAMNLTGSLNVQAGEMKIASGTLTLTETSVNKGSLSISGAIVVNDLNSFKVTGGSYSNGNHGYMSGNASYVIFENTGSLNLTGATLGGVLEGKTLTNGCYTTSSHDANRYHVNWVTNEAASTVTATNLGEGKKYSMNGGILVIDSSITVDAADATAEENATARATAAGDILEAVVGNSGTVKLTTNATITSNNVTSCGADLVVEGTTTQQTVLKVGGTLAHNENKSSTTNIASFKSITLDNGKLDIFSRASSLNNLTVTTNNGEIAFTDFPDGAPPATPYVLAGNTVLNGNLSVAAGWKYAMNIKSLTGEGDLILKKSFTGGGVSAFSIDDLSGYEGSIYVQDTQLTLTLTDTTWTGNVVYDKAAKNNNIIADLERFNNIGSAKLTLSGVAGYLNTLNNNVSLTKDIQLINPTGGYAVVICNGNGNQTASVDGAVSGTGDFVFNPNQYDAWNWENVTYNFSGDLSQWSGNIIDANTQTGSNKNLTIKFSGNATDIGVSVVNNNAVDEAHGIAAANTGDNLKLIIANDKAVTMNGKIDVDTLEINNTAVTKFTNTVTTTNLTLAATSGLSLGANASLSVANTNGITIGADQSLVTEGAATLDSALTFNGGSLAIGGSLNLGDNALTLSATNKTALTLADGMVGENVTMVNLFTHVTDVLGITGITTGVKLDSVFDVDASLADLYLKYNASEKVLMLTSIIAETREWTQKDGVNAGTWAEGYAFGATGATDAPVFAENDYAVFGSLAADHTVTIGAPLDTAQGTAARVDAGSLTVNAGAGKKYTFTGGEIHTPLLTITSGTAEFTANTLQLSELGEESISIAKDGVLDLSAYEVSIFQQMYTKATGEGAIVLNEGQVMLTGDLSIDINTQMAGDELRLNANNVSQNAVVTLNKALSYTDATNSFLRLESGAKLLVADKGVLEVSKVELGHEKEAGNVGHLEIATGGTVTAGSVAITTGSGGGTLVVNGGTLELTGTEGVAAGISTTITAGTLVADTASWSITGATIGGWDAVNNAPKVTISGTQTITLNNATLTSTLKNTGNLNLAGTINISNTEAAAFQTTKNGADWFSSTGDTNGNGFRFATLDYTIATGTGTVTTADGLKWSLNGTELTIAQYKLNLNTATENSSDKVTTISIMGQRQDTLYWVNHNTVTYDGTTPADGKTLATGYALNGGILQLNESLASTLGITKESKPGTINLNGTDVTLTSAQVTGTGSATLTGNGVYDLGTVTNLGTAITEPNAMKVTLGETWTGTVKLGGTVAGAVLKSLGKESSTVEIAGLSGYLSTDNNEVCDVNLKLTGEGLTITENTVEKEYQFSGAVAGTGDFAFNADNAKVATYTFSGDMAEWEGGFVVSKNSADVALKLLGGDILFADGSKGIVMNGSGALNVTIGNTTKATTMNGDISKVADATLNLTTEGKVKMAGTLADGIGLTNNGTLELTQDTASLASLAGTGSVTAKSLTLTGADNAISSLTLSTGLTLGVAAAGDDAGVVSSLAVTTLTVNNTNKMGLVTINNLNAATRTTPAILKAGSLAGSLTFAFDDALLETMVGATDTKSLVLMEITGGKADSTKLLLKAFGESTDPAATSQISRDQRYTYSLKWDAAKNQLKLEAQLCGVYWNGTNAPDDPALWTEDSSWATSIGEPVDEAPSDTVAAVISGGDNTIFVKGAADTLSLTVDVWRAFRESYDLQSYNGSGFFTPAGVEDKLTIEKNLVVNAGALNVKVDTEVKGDLVVKSNGRFFNHDGDKREDVATSLQVKGNLDNAGTLFKNHMGATLTVEGKATNSGTLANGTALTGQETTAGSGDAIITIAGQLTNTGAITNGEAGKLTIGSITGYDPEGSDIVNTGVITNAGTLAAARDMANSGVYTQTDGSLYVGGNLTNTGVASEENRAAGMNITGGKVTVGTMTNNGTLNLSDASLELNGYSYTAAPGPVSTLKPIVQAAELVNTGTMNITNGAQVTVNTITVGKQTAVGTVTNTGEIKVTEGSLTTSTMDNDGTLTIGGAKDAEGNVLASVKVTGGLDNTAGNIVIGSAATETDKATYGSLSVGGNLTHAGNGNIVVNSGSSLDVKGDLAANGMTLDFDGVVTVGGNAVVNNLTNDGTFTADNATIGKLVNNGTLSVGEVGAGGNLIGGKLTITTLTGTGAVNVGKDGSLTITDAAAFSGKLNNQGKLELKGATLIADQAEGATAGNITTEIVTVKSTATGYNGGSYVMGDIKTDALVIEDIDAAGTAARLDMNSLAAKTTDGVVSITISDADMAAVVDAGKGSYDLISVGSVLSGLNLTNNDDLTTAYMQALLAKGLNMELRPSEAAATAAVAAAVKTVVKLNVREQTADESIWNFDGAHNTTEAGLIVLKDGKLASNVVLDKVQTVKVTDSQSLDLTGDISKVTLNGLTAVNADSSVAQKLTITGDAGDTATVTTAASGYAGTVVLDKVTGNVSGMLDTVKLTNKAAANLAVTNTEVEALTSGLTLNGSMKGGELSISKADGVKGTLKIDGTDLNIAYDDKGALSMSIAKVPTTGHVLVNMDKITGEAGDIFIGKDGEASKLMEKYFTNVRFEDKKGVVADRNTVYYTSKLTYSASSDNGKAGLAMADESLLSYNPQNTNPTGDLAKVLEKLDEYVTSGNKAGADKLGASLAGASTAVLGMAAMGDVDRQLRAIRNRTTTMGVDQSVVNADMPYFNAWINAEGDSREMGEDETLGGYKLNSYGGTVGFDVDIEPTFTAGMALTAMYGDLDTTGADKATGNLDSYYVSAFARYCGSAWTHTFVGTIGMSDISLDRTVGTAQVQGETDAMSFGLMYEVGRVYAMDEDGTTCLQPVFNVTWKHTTVDAYTEKGGDVALKVDEQSLNTITFGLGARMQTVVGESMYNRTSIFECRLLAKADAGDTEGTSKVALGSSATHEVKSNEKGAVGIELGAGLTIPLGDEGSSIFMDASAEIRADYTDVNGTVGYRVNF